MTDKKRKSLGKPISLEKYPFKPSSFRTRRDGTRYPIGVAPTIRNVDIDAAVMRINERFNETKRITGRVVAAQTVTELVQIQDEVIHSSHLDPYDQQVLVENVIDKKFVELMRESGRMPSGIEFGVKVEGTTGGPVTKGVGFKAEGITGGPVIPQGRSITDRAKKIVGNKRIFD